MKNASRFGTTLISLLALTGIAVGSLFYFDMENQRRMEREAFAQLEGCTDVEPFHDFITRFPDSKHAPEVRQLLHEVQHLQDSLQQVATPSLP